MSTESESSFSPEKGVSLYSKNWTPIGPVKAILVFVHGFSEHINRYNSFFPILASQGIKVTSWDQRGWGRSAVNKSDWGLTGPTSLVVSDIATFINQTIDQHENNENNQKPPVFVMGHSMGGGEVCTLISDPQYSSLVSRVRGWVLEAPFIGFTSGEEPSQLKIILGRLVGRIFPRQQLKHVIPPELISRDPEVVESIRNDPLCHNTGTLEGMASMLDRTAALTAVAAVAGGSAPPGSVVLPEVRGLWLAHGTADKTCSLDAAMGWLARQEVVEDKKGKSYEGAYHQLHADLCKDEFASDLVTWILERSGDGEGNAGENRASEEEGTVTPKL